MSKRRSNRPIDPPQQNRGGQNRGGRSGGAVRTSGAGPSARGARARLAAERAAAERKRRQRRTFAGIGIGLGVALIIGAIVVAGMTLGGRSAAPTAMDGYAAQVDGPQVPATSGPISFGPESAPHTMQLFVDFRCPHCAEFERQYGEIIAEAEAAGRVRTEYYPMVVIDESSATAANGFACAAEAGFGRRYFNALFANPSTAWDTESLTDLANRLDGVEVPASFGNCVANDSYGSWVQSIDTVAQDKQVTGTPTIFVDDQLVPLQQLSEEQLRQLLA